jgi:hypothetical protein
MSRNPSAKQVTAESAYEAWANADETWMPFVLKKYKSSEGAAKP